MPTFPFIPPGGFAGFSSQTIAVKQLVGAAVKPKRRVTRKKRTTKPATRRRPITPKARPAARRKTTRKKRAHLVKGSAAAKRHMAKLRRMRKR